MTDAFSGIFDKYKGVDSASSLYDSAWSELERPSYTDLVTSNQKYLTDEPATTKASSTGFLSSLKGAVSGKAGQDMLDSLSSSSDDANRSVTSAYREAMVNNTPSNRSNSTQTRTLQSVDPRDMEREWIERLKMFINNENIVDKTRTK